MRTTMMAAVLTLLCAAACHPKPAKGPAEKAGEKIDNAAERTKDAAHDAAQDTKDAAHDTKKDLEKK